MKNTAHGNPIYISNGETKTISRKNSFSEREIQDLIFKYPDCLPISDIDESYNPVIPICKELWTPAGPLDIFMITPNGDLIIIETKLWRNPEARRRVIAQVLDYATEMSRWSYSDLQREVNKKTGLKGNSLYEIATKCHPNLILSEDNFVDAVSRNLRIGKILLIIAGDGIREGAKGIAEFLNKAGNLNFTFAMIEIPIYQTEDNQTIIFPRTIVKTTEIRKINIEVPEGFKLTEDLTQVETDYLNKEVSKETIQRREFFTDFWSKFINQLNLDDPGQPLPSVSMTQNLYIYPDEEKHTWISAYFSQSTKRIGVYYRFHRTQSSQNIKEFLSEFTEEIKNELGGQIIWNWEQSDMKAFSVMLPITDVYDSKNRQQIIDFFNLWINKFVNVIRPRLKQIE